MKLNDTERIKCIIEIWDSLSTELAQRNIDEAALLNDQFSQWAITTPLYNIGEHVYKISPEFKNKYPDIPWNLVSGLRHRLVHDYSGVNWTIVVEVVFKDMPEFVEQLRKII